MCNKNHLSDFEAEIRQNGIAVLQGDSLSMAVIFNNMTGKNISGDEYQHYKQYIRLQGVDTSLPVELWVGGKLDSSGGFK